MYKYTKNELIDIIKVGQKVKINDSPAVFCSFLDDNTSTKYYELNGRIYAYTSDEISKGIKKGSPVSKCYYNVPFYTYMNKTYCFIDRGLGPKECSFDDMYDKKRFDYDLDKFVVKSYEERINVISNMIDANQFDEVKELIEKEYSFNEQLVLSFHQNRFKANNDYQSFVYLVDYYNNKKDIDSVKKLLKYAKNNNIYFSPQLNSIYNKLLGSLVDCLKCDDTVKEINVLSTTTTLRNLYFPNAETNCFLCTKREDCWKKYDKECGNRQYWKKYHDDYTHVNNEFFNKLFELKIERFKNKKEISIVLVGCGNLYELESINELAKRYRDIKFDVIILDEGIWAYNSYSKIKDSFCINSLWIKNCDFNIELKNEMYSKADIIFYSRCLIHYDESVREKIFDNLEFILRDNQLTVFSQVVDVRYQGPVDFENMLRRYLLSHFINIVEYKLLKHNRKFDEIQWDLLKNWVKVQPNYPYQFYMYIVEGRK